MEGQFFCVVKITMIMYGIWRKGRSHMSPITKNFNKVPVSFAKWNVPASNIFWNIVPFSSRFECGWYESICVRGNIIYITTRGGSSVQCYDAQEQEFLPTIEILNELDATSPSSAGEYFLIQPLSSP